MAKGEKGQRAPIPRGTAELRSKMAEAAGRLPMPERREFLLRGLALAGASAAAPVLAAEGATGEESLPPHVPPWSRSLGRGVASMPYGAPSEFEGGVVRRRAPWPMANDASSISFTPLAELNGIITPNGLVFERHHAGFPAIDPGLHRLMIHGMVERPIVLTMDDLVRFPSVSVIRFIECAGNGAIEWRGPQVDSLQFTHGMLSCCEWTGVPLSVLLEEVGLQRGAAWVLAEGADGAAMSRSIPLDKALDDALVVYAQNGEALRPEQGYPVRLLTPGWEGVTNIKWLRRLEVGDQPWHQREETARYTDLMPDGRSREFSFVQECNSVITFPCPEKPPGERGRYEIEGLAWSGRGKIRRVDVSFDGGVNWRPARLKGVVLPKALTRFSLMWEWDGAPALLQSRAVDETGYVQPTLKQLREVRGVSSVYHKNAIHTWRLAENGTVTNVQVD
jgi:sulfane dehydrogenase subunit SoxC